MSKLLLAILLFACNAAAQDTLLIDIDFNFTVKETLLVHWPEKYKLKLINTEKAHATDKWGAYYTITEDFLEEGNEDIGVFATILTVVDMADHDESITLIVPSTQENLDEYGYTAKVAIIDSDAEAKNPWVLYSYCLEVPPYECSLLYTVTGNYNTYTCHIRINEQTFPDGFVEEWSAVLKNSELIKK